MLQVKVTHDGLTRLFGVETSGEFDDLMSRLQSIFKLNEPVTALSYTDEEGDRIMLDTYEELQSVTCKSKKFQLVTAPSSPRTDAWVFAGEQASGQTEDNDDDEKEQQQRVSNDEVSSVSSSFTSSQVGTANASVTYIDVVEGNATDVDAESQSLLQPTVDSSTADKGKSPVTEIDSDDESEQNPDDSRIPECHSSPDLHMHEIAQSLGNITQQYFDALCSDPNLPGNARQLVGQTLSLVENSMTQMIGLLRQDIENKFNQRGVFPSPQKQTQSTFGSQSGCSAEPMAEQKEQCASTCNHNHRSDRRVMFSPDTQHPSIHKAAEDTSSADAPQPRNMPQDLPEGADFEQFNTSTATVTSTTPKDVPQQTQDNTAFSDSLSALLDVLANNASSIASLAQQRAAEVAQDIPQRTAEMAQEIQQRTAEMAQTVYRGASTLVERAEQSFYAESETENPFEEELEEAEEDEADAAESVIENKLAQMYDMGFTDHQLNRGLLDVYKGDVNEVIEAIMADEEHTRSTPSYAWPLFDAESDIELESDSIYH